MKKAAAILIILLWTFTPAIAGTIYIWTDENGVRRFSDNPPEGVEDYETAVGSRSNATDGKREGLKKMLEEHQEEQENKDRTKEQEAEAARKAEQEQKAKAEQEQKAKAEQPDKVRDERKRLEQKIEALRKRGLSFDFTEGMRRDQIEEIQKQIDTLDRVK